MSSKRFPGKSLELLNGIPILEHVVNRIKAVNVLVEGLLDNIVVATSNSCDDLPITDWCEDNKIDCYRGQLDDVLDRFYQCAVKYGADWILRITGDCPLIEPVLLTGLLRKQPRMEYEALPFIRGKIPDGWDAELFSMELLKTTHETSADREHVTTEMRGNLQDIFDISLEEFDFKGIKLSVDTKKDLQKVEEYVKLL